VGIHGVWSELRRSYAADTFLDTSDTSYEFHTIDLGYFDYTLRIGVPGFYLDRMLQGKGLISPSGSILEGGY